MLGCASEGALHPKPPVATDPKGAPELPSPPGPQASPAPPARSPRGLALGLCPALPSSLSTVPRRFPAAPAGLVSVPRSSRGLPSSLHSSAVSSHHRRSLHPSRVHGLSHTCWDMPGGTWPLGQGLEWGWHPREPLTTQLSADEAVLGASVGDRTLL